MAPTETSGGPAIVESYRDFEPPPNFRRLIETLLPYIPPKYLIGLKTIVLTNRSGLTRDRVSDFQTPAEPEYKDGFKYGFKWWLCKLPDSTEYVWMAGGFGGQHLEVFPQEDLMVTLTAWDFLPSSTGADPIPSVFLALAKTKTCPHDAH